MKKYVISSLLALTGFSVHAADCINVVEPALKGSIVYMCAFGTGRTLAMAQAATLANVEAQFKVVCSASKDCKAELVFASPMRPVCTEVTPSFYSCDQQVMFDLVVK